VRVVRRLWTEEAVASDGPFFPFEAVGFEPKPARPVPILVGGESRRALARAAEYGDGRLGMSHDPVSARGRAEEFRELRARGGRAAGPFTITVPARDPGPGGLDAYVQAGSTG
jgi:alkanesulfonate monooxygenase SsuD/methylene tetrahydromethanopterin reductase-like flavin-dependent oxidoreductase (luciferase family)